MVTPAEIVMQQRNEALIRAADAELRHEMAARAAEAAFVALDACISSGQVPQEDAPRLIDSVPGFAAWRAQRPAR